MNPSTRRTAKQCLILALCAGPLAACLNINDPATAAQKRYGAISIFSRNGPNNTGLATPYAIFFDASNAGIPDSRGQPDACQFSTVDSNATDVSGQLQAGSTIELKLASQNVSMTYDATLKRYSTGATKYSYGIDDSVQVTVPGQTDGFPASSINVKLAQPIKPGSVAVPAIDQPLNVTWNAISDTTSAVVLSLRYANPSTKTYANEQILCALKDDGAYSIPSSALAAFLASPNSLRSLVVTRWRTRQANINPTTLLHIVSSIDTTIFFP